MQTLGLTETGTNEDQRPGHKFLNAVGFVAVGIAAAVAPAAHAQSASVQNVAFTQGVDAATKSWTDPQPSFQQTPSGQERTAIAASNASLVNTADALEKSSAQVDANWASLSPKQQGIIAGAELIAAQKTQKSIQDFVHAMPAKADGSAFCAVKDNSTNIDYFDPSTLSLKKADAVVKDTVEELRATSDCVTAAVPTETTRDKIQEHRHGLHMIPMVGAFVAAAGTSQAGLIGMNVQLHMLSSNVQYAQNKVNSFIENNSPAGGAVASNTSSGGSLTETVARPTQVASNQYKQ